MNNLFLLFVITIVMKFACDGIRDDVPPFQEAGGPSQSLATVLLAAAEHAEQKLLGRSVRNGQQSRDAQIAERHVELSWRHPDPIGERPIVISHIIIAINIRTIISSFLLKWTSLPFGFRE